MAAEHKPMNGQGRTSQAAITQRRIRAWELRITGMSLRKIASELEVSVGTVFNDLEAHAKQIQQAPAEELRKVELQRLDHLIEKLWPRVEEGDPGAVNAFLKVQERRAKMLGLDAPTKVDTTVHQVDPMDTALGELIRETRARQAVEEQVLKGGGGTDAISL